MKWIMQMTGFQMYQANQSEQYRSSEFEVMPKGWMQADRQVMRRRRRWLLTFAFFLLSAVALGSWFWLKPVKNGQVVNSDAIHQTGTQRKGSALDERVRLLAAELGLDPRQQAEVRRLLVSQREQVKRLWDDSSLPAPNRVAATQTISEQTADRIRALLNEAQRKKYIKPRQKHEPAEGSTQRSVEDWMNAAKSK